MAAADGSAVFSRNNSNEIMIIHGTKEVYISTKVLSPISQKAEVDEAAGDGRNLNKAGGK